MVIITTSAHFAASATVFTVRPAASAFARDAEPSRRPTTTCTPDSFRLSAWACPCDPYPMIATFFERMSAGSASLS